MHSRRGDVEGIAVGATWNKAHLDSMGRHAGVWSVLGGLRGGIVRNAGGTVLDVGRPEYLSPGGGFFI